MFDKTARKILKGASRTHGFTLVELMITVAVGAVLIVLALPSFRELSIRSNVTNITNQLVLALNAARSEAVRRGTQVEVVNSTGSNIWTASWSVKADSNNDGSFTVTDTVVTAQSGAPTGYSVCSKSTGGGADQAVVFDQTGALVKPVASFDINVNRPDGNRVTSQHITIKGSGEVQTQKNTTSSPAPTSC